MLFVCVVLQLLVQYRLNLWNRDFFNALERRDGSEIWHQTYLLPIFAAMSIGLAISDAGAREPQLAEYRIAEDARVATYAPIDLSSACWPRC